MKLSFAVSIEGNVLKATHLRLSAFGVLMLLLLGSGCTSSYTPAYNQTFKKGHYVTSGNSMLPTFKPNSVAYVQPRSFSEIQQGDIVVYVYQNNYVMHRAIAKYAGEWVVMGDNEEMIDQVRVNVQNFRGIAYPEPVDYLGEEYKGSLLATKLLR